MKNTYTTIILKLPCKLLIPRNFCQYGVEKLRYNTVSQLSSFIVEIQRKYLHFFLSKTRRVAINSTTKIERSLLQNNVNFRRQIINIFMIQHNIICSFHDYKSNQRALSSTIDRSTLKNILEFMSSHEVSSICPSTQLCRYQKILAI